MHMVLSCFGLFCFYNIVDSCNLFTHILQGCLTVNGAVVWLLHDSPCAGEVTLKNMVNVDKSWNRAYFAVYVITYPCQRNLFHSRLVATANQGLITIIIIQHY